MDNQVHVLPSSPAARENALVQRNFSRLDPRLRGEQDVQVGILSGLHPLCLPFKKKMANAIFPSKARVGVPLNEGIRGNQ